MAVTKLSKPSLEISISFPKCRAAHSLAFPAGVCSEMDFSFNACVQLILLMSFERMKGTDLHALLKGEELRVEHVKYQEPPT